MRVLVVAALVILCVVPAQARGRSAPRLYGTGSKPYSTQVRGHFKPSAGRYVLPHSRSTGDRTQFNNWSTKGNVNLRTGKPGTKWPVK